MLVSNDVQRERQVRTLHRAWSQPCVPLLVTCADATSFALRAPARAGAPLPLFDRVLCDVPCSGDGTLRKSPDVLSRWSVRSGLRAHPLQLAILQRGLALLAPGGRLAYSTCSLDPLQACAAPLPIPYLSESRLQHHAPVP